jgi:hypothetical protein
VASAVSAPLWAAVEGLASVWRSTDIVPGYAEMLTRRTQGLGGGLAMILARFDNLEAQPLLLAHLLQATPDYQRFKQQPGAEEFLQRGGRLGQAFLETVEWWRSRLPGYPNMPVPQLVRGGPLSSDEVTFRVPWPRGLRGQRLQFTPAPPTAAGLLGMPAPAADAAARAIGTALVGSPQVQALQQAQEALTDEDRAALTSARDRARAALSPPELDAKAGELLLNRLAYREAVDADAVESLYGNARRYSQAFAAVDRLLEQAAALLSQAVVYGPARRLGPVLRAERLHGGDGWTEIIVPEPWPPLRLAEVALFDSPALANAMFVEGMTIRLGRTSGVATVRGRLLPDSPGLRV